MISFSANSSHGQTAQARVLKNGDLLSNISVFLNPSDRAATKLVNRVFSASFTWTKARFEKEFGEALPSEKGLPLKDWMGIAHEIHRRIELKWLIQKDQIPIVKRGYVAFERFDEGTFWSRFVRKVLYYIGYEHAALMKNLAAQANQKLAQFNELERSPKPDTIAAFRGRWVRAFTVYEELRGLEQFAQEMEGNFDWHTRRLSWLLSKICAYVQRFVFFFMKPSQFIEEIKQAKEQVSSLGLDRTVDPRTRSLSWESRRIGRLEDLRTGKSSQSPNKVGMKIGEVDWIIENQKEVFGIYILPLIRHDLFDWDAKISSVCLGLSRDGVCFDGYIDFNKQGHLRLDCCIEDKVGQIEATGDHPIMRALVQICVEVLLNTKRSQLTCSFASLKKQPILYCAGFRSKSSTQEDYRNAREEVEQARKDGKKFPDWLPEAGALQLYISNQNNSLLNQPVDFGVSTPLLTWEAVIKDKPILTVDLSCFFT